MPQNEPDAGPQPDRAVPVLEDVQRVAAYGLLPDDAGRVVLVRASEESELQGTWFLPGGGVDFGEHPRDAVVREVAEETGVDVRVSGLRAVLSDVLALPHRGQRVHTLRVLYDLEGLGRGWPARLRPEPDGTSDAVRLVDPAHLAGPDDPAAPGTGASGALPVMPYVAHALGRPAPPEPVVRRAATRRRDRDAGRSTGGPVAAFGVAEGGALDPDHPDHPDLDALHDDALARVQRAAAYALCHDAGRVLLTRLRDTDLWTLPGGGIDHGEDPATAAVREVHEETGLPVALGRLLDVDSIRFTGQGPAGRQEDFHGIRVIYAGQVPTDVAPRVVEVDGSTEEAAWWPVDQARRLRLAGLVRVALTHLP